MVDFRCFGGRNRRFWGVSIKSEKIYYRDNSPEIGFLDPTTPSSGGYIHLGGGQVGIWGYVEISIGIDTSFCGFG